MIRKVCVNLSLLALLALPGCVAAIGNTGYGAGSYPKTIAPLLEERVEAARRILELRQARLDHLRPLFDSGRIEHATLVEAEIAVEEARLQLLQCRAELSALRNRKDDDD